MTATAVIVTGHLGGLGTALCTLLVSKGYHVVGIDQDEDPSRPYPQIEINLRELISADLSGSAKERIRERVGSTALKALVNNAATQVVKPLDQLEWEDWERSLTTNAAAPLLLSKLLLKELVDGEGTIVNVGSIHARQSKPGFGAYAVSKAALSGVTRAMATEWGDRVRVVELQPAAVATQMLEAGFVDAKDKRHLLDQFHPTGGIGQPEEFARLVLSLIEIDAPFLNGSIINFDGGISHVLNDPGN